MLLLLLLLFVVIIPVTHIPIILSLLQTFCFG